MQRLISHFQLRLSVLQRHCFLGLEVLQILICPRGAGEQECACRYAGTGLVMLMLCGVTIAVIVLLFLDPLLHVFGVTKDVLPYAQDYTGITAFGIPFLVRSRLGVW